MAFAVKDFTDFFFLPVFHFAFAKAVILWSLVASSLENMADFLGVPKINIDTSYLFALCLSASTAISVQLVDNSRAFFFNISPGTWKSICPLNYAGITIKEFGMCPPENSGHIQLHHIMTEVIIVNYLREKVSTFSCPVSYNISHCSASVQTHS